MIYPPDQNFVKNCGFTKSLSKQKAAQIQIISVYFKQKKNYIPGQGNGLEGNLTREIQHYIEKKNFLGFFFLRFTRVGFNF